jgi:L-seryl-tRNA(Ser) seleniumtransferase
MIASGTLSSPVKVINATGVVLHTGLGRAVLPASVRQAMYDASGYTVLEVERESGKRGERIDSFSRLILEATGAQAGMAVNNNAAAVLLALSALVSPGKVVIAQSHLVEIGGSFRLPEVFAQSGCQFVAVGAANTVRLSDYAIGLEQGAQAIFVAHHSNFWFQGEHSEPTLAELVAFAHEAGVPLLYDLGTGAMLDLSHWGIDVGMTVGGAVQAGADLVCFSGDKLFGGPQAGIVVGRKNLTDKLLHHPLYRSLRLGKNILAGLCAMLDIYRRGEEYARAEIPTLAMLTELQESIQARAKRLLGLLPLEMAIKYRVAETTDKPGGGTLPQVELPGWALAIRPTGLTLRDLARRLRLGEPSVWGRLSGKDLWLDMRTVTDCEVEALAGALSRAMLQ